MSKQKIGEIDLVYMWVDGKDPNWQEKKLLYTGQVSDQSETNNMGRYVSNDELKYSLRSAEKHAPWIRKIFIVTDNQVPVWLDRAHPKIKVVDHQEIMPPEILPCFNSSVIEYFLYKIPGLAERFLLANDDMFFNADVTPDFFFVKDGFPIVRLKRKPLGKWHYRFKVFMGKNIGQYSRMVIDSALLVERLFGKYYPGVPHHNIDAYLKSNYQRAVEDVFHDQIKRSQQNRVRAYGDLHRSAFGYYFLAVGRGKVKYVKRKESFRILTYRHDVSAYIQRYKPKLFCLNDSEHLNDQHRKKISNFLDKHFPMKSTFEYS